MSSADDFKILKELRGVHRVARAGVGLVRGGGEALIRAVPGQIRCSNGVPTYVEAKSAQLQQESDRANRAAQPARSYAYEGSEPLF
ncbi:hypothetical protein CCM_00958 [Cordyceps militaris CM01]|uniref:Uncharacterized protein n=1 Tax=Cordyceps militaris (strain CM01) TaxID=983644 RepID=G3J7D2_CORMM|nr:uncharacterized protein CCM_00958 [Cordyceps militaris CM01]EGX96302.1 hypothetical protein CCM_00958 [Cordyceps militaris CM01]